LAKKFVNEGFIQSLEESEQESVMETCCGACCTTNRQQLEAIGVRAYICGVVVKQWLVDDADEAIDVLEVARHLGR